MFYGVHGNSGYLFRFDPQAERVEVLDRITSLPSRRAGMFDQFSYGYLGFTLGPDGRTLYYLTGGPVYVEGQAGRGQVQDREGRVEGDREPPPRHLRHPHGGYTDHGPIFFADGRRPAYVNSIAVGKDGTVYTLARIPKGEGTAADLISIQPPSPNPRSPSARRRLSRQTVHKVHVKQ